MTCKTATLPHLCYIPIWVDDKISVNMDQTYSTQAAGNSVVWHLCHKHTFVTYTAASISIFLWPLEFTPNPRKKQQFGLICLLNKSRAHTKARATQISLLAITGSRKAILRWLYSSRRSCQVLLLSAMKIQCARSQTDRTRVSDTAHITSLSCFCLLSATPSTDRKCHLDVCVYALA